MQNLHSTESDQRRLFCGLGQYRVASDQGGADLARKNSQWKIPGADTDEHPATMQGQFIVLTGRPDDVICGWPNCSRARAA